MDPTEPITRQTTDLELAAAVDQVCRRFEDGWNAGQRPQIESFVAECRADGRQAVLAELLAIEIERRLQEGEQPEFDEYASRFPDVPSIVSSAFQQGVAGFNTVTDGNGSLPDRIADFRVTREIGRGGMGVVYEAVQESLGRRVALKTLPAHSNSQGDRLARFRREARAIARLHHSNIVDVFGSGSDDGTAFIAMRLIDGQGLDRLIHDARSGSRESDTSASLAPTEVMSPSAPTADDHQSTDPHAPQLNRSRGELTARSRDAARVGREIAEALQYAHGQGVLHRDVKPSNILIDNDGTARLADFGLAKVAAGDEAASLTEEGSLLGTLRYLPPENLHGEADARGDVYSLGLVLYELLALEPALSGANYAEMMRKANEGLIERLESLVPGVPSDMATIIHKAIERDPAARYQTAGDLAEDLRRFSHDEPIRARRISALEHLVRWSRRNKGLAAALSSVAVLLLIIAVSSSIAAGHFSTLNSSLNTTVGELEVKTEELTGARNKAREDAAENLRLAREANAIAADMQTERGVLALEEGDAASAMLWFANAAAGTPHDSFRASANRLRARNAMDQALLPVASFRHNCRGHQKRLEFQPLHTSLDDNDGQLAGEDTQIKAKGVHLASESTGLHRNLLLVAALGRIEIWDWQSNEVLPWTSHANAQISTACWMPGGREVAIVLKNGRVQLRAVPDGRVRIEFDSDLVIETICCAPNGDRLAIGGNGVEVWNVSGEPELEHKLPHPQPVYAMTFNPSGNRLATACRDSSARVFAIGSVSDDDPLFRPVPHWTELGTSPPLFFGDDLIVTADNEIIQWRDATTGQRPQEFPDLLLPPVYQLTSSNDEKWMAICTRSTCEIVSKDGERKTHKHPDHVYDAAFCPDGALVTACYDWNGRLRGEPLTDKRPIRIPQLQAAENCAASADGSVIAVSGDDFVRVWQREPSRGKLAAPGWAPARWRPRVSFDGGWVTRGRCHSLRVTGNPAAGNLSKLSVLDTTNGQPVGPTINLSEMVDSCCCADRRSVAVISQTESGGLLSLYKIGSGKLEMPPIELDAKPHSIASRPGHSQVAVMGENGEVRVVDTGNGDSVHILPHSGWLDWFYGRFARTTYTPDGETLIVLLPDGKIWVRNADTGQELFSPIDLKLQRRLALCPAIDISADSRLLATAITGRNAVQVWDLTTGRALCPPIPHPGDLWGLYAVRFSPDQKLVFTANKDGVARVWDWRKGTMVCPPLEHPAEVYDVAFLSDGKYGLTVDRSDTVRIWELTTGKLIAAPIHYPTRDDGSPLALFKVAIVGNRAVLGAPDFPVLDLSPILREPELSTESLLAIAELASALRVTRGGSSSLNLEQWQETWNSRANQPLREGLNSTSELLASLRSEELNPSTHSKMTPGATRAGGANVIQDVTELLAQRLDATADARGQKQLLERRGVTWEVLDCLLALRPNNAQLHLIRARWLEKLGEQNAAKSSRQRGIGLIEQQLTLHRNDQFLASQLAELLLRTNPTRWHHLEITKATSTLGATLTVKEDGSILASGKNLAGDRYFVEATSEIEQIAAIRLEVLTDSSLPFSGPGRHASGNFQLEAIRLSSIDIDDSDIRTSIPFKDAWASYSWHDPIVNVLGTIDDNDRHLWHVWGRLGEPHEATFSLGYPVTIRPDKRLLIELQHHTYEGVRLNLGRFRLSATSDRAVKLQKLRESIRDGHLYGLKALAAVYRALGEVNKADKVAQGLKSASK